MKRYCDIEAVGVNNFVKASVAKRRAIEVGLLWKEDGSNFNDSLRATLRRLGY